MKKIFLTLLLTSIYQFSFSQQSYYPLIQEDKTWYVAHSNYGGPTNTLVYKCEGDTIIDNNSYKIVYNSNEEFPVNWAKLGFIHEDENHKIYYSQYHSNDPSFFEPKLLYDFNANVGDSVTITTYPYNDPIELEILITDIDSVIVDGEYRKRTLFVCDMPTPSFWIEGIGSSNGLLEPGFYCTIICPTCELACVKEQETTIYPDGHTGSCFVVGIDEFSTEKKYFDIFPNPAVDYFMVTPKNSLQSKVKFELFSLLGQSIHSTNLTINYPTRIKPDELKSGIYLYVISDENNVVQKGKIVVR